MELIHANKVCLNEIIKIFKIFLTNTHDFEFRFYLNSQLSWLYTLHSDFELYDHRNKERVILLKNFLKNPKQSIDEFDIASFQEYVDMKRAFIQRIHNYDGVFRGTAEYNLDDFFTEIVSELETILERVPPSNYKMMKENNREFYHELNKVVLKPERIGKMSQQFGIEWFEYLDAIMD